MRGVELRTKRLLLRPWRDSDLEPMAAIEDRPAETIERSRLHWEAHRYGFYALEARAGPLAGELVGFCGVQHPTRIPELAERAELGCRLARPARGRGFATEAAIACRDDAFYRVGLPELISLIDSADARAQRLAEKLGMTPGPSAHDPRTGTDPTVWSLPAP